MHGPNALIAFLTCTLPFCVTMNPL